jgi:hypothetical protein
MKNTIKVLLVALFIVALTGCSSPDETIMEQESETEFQQYDMTVDEYFDEAVFRIADSFPSCEVYGGTERIDGKEYRAITIVNTVRVTGTGAIITPPFERSTSTDEFGDSFNNLCLTLIDGLKEQTGKDVHVAIILVNRWPTSDEVAFTSCDGVGRWR